MPWMNTMASTTVRCLSPQWVDNLLLTCTFIAIITTYSWRLVQKKVKGVQTPIVDVWLLKFSLLLQSSLPYFVRGRSKLSRSQPSGKRQRRHTWKLTLHVSRQCTRWHIYHLAQELSVQCLHTYIGQDPCLWTIHQRLAVVNTDH